MTKSKFYSLITFALAVFLMGGCAAEAESQPEANAAAPVAEQLQKADESFRGRENPDKLREAVKTLAAARNPDRRNYEVEWKFAKYNYFLGKQATDVKEREKAFEDGKLAGRIASRLEPAKADGYFWYGANLGEQAKISPVTVGVKSVGEIKEAMNKVIEIDPRYENASAFDGLAQIELSTAGLMGGKPEKAVEYLEKGLEIGATNSHLHLRLAEAYLATGKKDEAKKRLEFVLKMKPNPEYVPEHLKTVEKARKMLETRF